MAQALEEEMSVFSSAFVGALFHRPESVPDLLRNLKLAYEKDLFRQPGFFADENLLKFFAGAAVTWENARPLTSERTSARDILIAPNVKVFPHLTVTMFRSCAPESRYVAPNHYVVDHLAQGTRLDIRIGALAGFTVRDVRGVFGAETAARLDFGTLNDEFRGPSSAGRSIKGHFVYEDHAASPDWSKDVIFVVKLATRADSTDDKLNDTDSIESIRASQSGR